MKNSALKIIITSLMFFAFAAPGLSVAEEDVVDKAGRGIEKGANATGKGLKKGAEATEKGVKKGAEATGKGVKKAGDWVGKKMDKVFK